VIPAKKHLRNGKHRNPEDSCRNRQPSLVEPDILEYDKINKPQYDLILGVKTMKKYGIILDFKDKMKTVDEVKLPMRNINYLQGSSNLRVLWLDHSLAMEPQSTQDATKRVTRILDAKYQKADL
jgi:hypothetical protein